MKKFEAILTKMFGLDYRSLALMRIGIGVTILLDLIQRSTSLFVHYSDQGILPRADYLDKWYNKWYVSLHMASGMAGFEGVLFVIAGIFAIMLILGYRTRLAIVVSWFLLISLHNRNPLVLQGGDVIFRAAVFWMMFLPLGSRFSLDRILNRIPRPKQNMILGVETIAYIIQVGLFYFMTGFLKTGTAWQDGTAVYYALSVDQLTTWFGTWLSHQDYLTHPLTIATRYLEYYGAFLFITPVLSGPLRTLAVFLFAGLQFGFNISMHLGLFGLICIVITLGILPSWFWDTLVLRMRHWFEKRAKGGLSIYYDYDCTFCSKVTRIIKQLLMLSPTTVVLPSSTDKAIEAKMLEKNSWVVIDQYQNQHFGFDGIVTVISYSPLFAPFALIGKIPGISHIGEYCYRLVANKRTLVCKPEEPEQPWKMPKKILYGAQSILVGGLLIYIILWNMDTTGKYNFISQKNEWVGWLTRIDQKFDMFAPTPLTEDGWYIIPGTLRDGTGTDVFREKLNTTNYVPVSYEKPKSVSSLYKNQRWQKYMMNLWGKSYAPYRELYGKYICREWNGSHGYDQNLMDFKMVFMLEKTPPEGQPLPTAIPTTIWEHHCF